MDQASASACQVLTRTFGKHWWSCPVDPPTRMFAVGRVQVCELIEVRVQRTTSGASVVRRTFVLHERPPDLSELYSDSVDVGFSRKLCARCSPCA